MRRNIALFMRKKTYLSFSNKNSIFQWAKLFTINCLPSLRSFFASSLWKANGESELCDTTDEFFH